VVLLIPGAVMYNTFRQRAGVIFPKSLPGHSGRRIGMSRSLDGVVHFQRDWTPMAEFCKHSFRSAVVQHSLRHALKPVCEKLGISWSPPKTSISELAMRLLFPLFLFGLILTSYWVIQDLRRLASPFYRAAGEVGERLFADPDVQHLFKGLSQKAANATGAELVKNGFLRLSDEDVVRRVTLLAELLEAADAETCAGIILGTANRNDIIKLIDKLGHKTIEEWFQLSQKALLAEARDRPPPRPLYASSVERAAREIRDQMGPETAIRFDEAFRNPALTPYPTLC
jgi:hypothetical protein